MITYIFIHHTGVSRIVNPDQFNATNTYHQQVFNMKSSLGFWVGYNYEISASGQVRQARVDGEETAAQLLHNKDSLSICMDGNFDIEMPTQAQIDALKTLCLQKMAQYSIPIDNVHPHRYVATYIAEGQPFQANTGSYKTIDGCLNYKSCYGSNLSDKWITDLLTPPIVNQPPVDCQPIVNEANNNLIMKIMDFLKSLLK